MKKKKENNQTKKSISKIPLLTKGEIIFTLLIILLFTFIAYSPALKAGFVNWDDQQYVYENQLITSFAHLKELLFTPVQGNMHPLTMLSLAINYSISGQNAWSYHLFNIIFHLANTMLVFFLARRLSKENAIISVTTAVLFALHPMHVESVAWVSERKDVLYSFFFLLGLLSYVKYIDKNSRTAYALSLFWLILSLASKPAAVIFPVVLFTVDILRQRKFTFKLIAEKIPFFVFAAVLGFLTLHYQSAVGTTEGQNYFGINDRFFFGFYGFFMYIVKLIAPFNLVPFYPFPTVGKALPILYYLSPVFFITIGIVCLKTIKKFPVFTFGFSFYFVNLLLVLQFFIVGSAIIADRYTYIPYIGIFYILGWMIDRWQKQSFKKAMIYITVIGLFLTGMTYNQASTWKSSTTLWDHAIKVHPTFRAYNSRGSVYRNEGFPEKAIDCYNEALKLNKTDPEIYTNRGNAYSEIKKYAEALNDYNSALAIKPDYVAAYANRGSLYGSTGKFELAINDLTKVIQKDPNYISAYPNRATAYLEYGKYDEAIADYTKFLEFKPNDVDILNMIAVCYQHLKKYDESITVFNKMISINPKPIFYLNRSYSWKGLNKIDEARKDALTAKQGGVDIPDGYVQFLGL